MYIPSYFRESDNAELIRFIKEYPFGILVSASDDVPMATHLPFVIEYDNNELIILSHLAKSNPHWQYFSPEREVLLIFTGPQAYISPTHYEHKRNVPTWNFTAVHLFGNSEIITSKSEILNLMYSSIKAFEPEYIQQWEQLSDDYVRLLLDEIIAFKVNVTRMEGKYKLSQNKKAAERMNIISSFEKADDTEKKRLAEMMKKKL